MPTLRVAFTDMLQGFDPCCNLWIELLRESQQEVVGVEALNDADLLIYSDWGTRHQDFRGLKIYTTGENMLPDYDECDFAFTSMHLPDESRHVRLPYYFFALPDPMLLVRKPDFDPEHVLACKSRFCNFMVSNPRGRRRNRFFKLLNRHQTVDSGGKHFNNLGYRVSDKQEFISKYKFTIAFENSLTSGYTTEKLVDPMLVGSLPIYWGNPLVSIDFNPRSFINAAAFSSLEALADHVLEVHHDDRLFLRYLSEPPFPDNKPTEYLSRRRLSQALGRFLADRPTPGARNYKRRRLRQHAYQHPCIQSLESLLCRLDSLLWHMRHGKVR